MYCKRFLSFLVVLLFLTTNISFLFAQKTKEIIDIGSRRELFVDGFMIESISGKAQRVLHHPEPKGVAIVHDQPWEGNTCGYHSLFKDGGIYRMYYRGSHIATTKESLKEAHPFYICYAESADGISWTKPELGIYEVNGSKKNNIVIMSGNIAGVALKMGDNASMFKDLNPDAPADARYKAFVCSSDPRGLFAFKSADAIHWLPMADKPVITEGAFDSQNVGFWDSVKKEYRAYWRYFKNGKSENTLTSGGVRAVRTAVSKDFIHWTDLKDVTYDDTMRIELYTNQVNAYYRAPHILLGIPTRYIELGWSPSMRALPDLPHRELRSSRHLRYGTALTDAMLMSSRDGVSFDRWEESFFRPGIERTGTWNYGHQYICWGIAQTRSDLPGAPDEMSFYSTENSWTNEARTSDLRRYTMRLDGFVSVNAPMSGGEIVTRPFRFKGSKLSINFSTSVAGSVKVEIQDAKGAAIPGLALKDIQPVFGDTIERVIEWKEGSDLRALSGKPVRLRFVLHDADLYSFHFSD
jgi:hypothetical protein